MGDGGQRDEVDELFVVRMIGPAEARHRAGEDGRVEESYSKFVFCLV
jgi:hypothetical protein